MAEKIRWGIIGCGFIASQFAEGLKALDDAVLVAVASRNEMKANQFAKEYDAEIACSYEEIVVSEEVDVIYVATPHTEHMKLSILCMEHGKHVLCEKPFAINQSQSEKMIQCARENKTFLMEAMWTRFIPGIVKLDELLQQGVIGDPKLMRADFGFKGEGFPDGRLFDPHLGGGSLLDVGIYPLFLSSFIFGNPVKMSGSAEIGKTGVDETAAFTIQYRDGAVSQLYSSIVVDTPATASIYGTEGQLHLESPFWKPEILSLKRNGRAEERIECPIKGNGYQYEAKAVGDALRANKQEHDYMTWEDTLRNMSIMDELRKIWGIQYPCEKVSC